MHKWLVEIVVNIIYNLIASIIFFNANHYGFDELDKYLIRNNLFVRNVGIFLHETSMLFNRFDIYDIYDI